MSELSRFVEAEQRAAREVIEGLEQALQLGESLARACGFIRLLELLSQSPSGDFPRDLKDVFCDPAGEPLRFTRWLGIVGDPPPELVELPMLRELDLPEVTEEIAPYRELWQQAREKFSWLAGRWRLEGEQMMPVDAGEPFVFTQSFDPDLWGRPLFEPRPPKPVQDAIARVENIFEPLSGPLNDLFQMPGVEESLRPRERPVLRTQSRTAASQEESDDETVPLVDRYFPPHLKILALRLRNALEKEDPVGSCHCVLENLDFLVRYFASVAGGAVGQFEEVPDQYMKEPDFEDCLGVLRRSLNLLRRAPSSTLSKSILAVFSAEGPAEHLRWLGLDDQEGGENLAVWRVRTENRIDEEDVAACAALVAEALPVLSSWLVRAKTFFRTWDVDYRLRLDFNLDMCFTRGDDAFDALPFVDPERYGARLTQVELQLARDNLDWEPARLGERSALAKLKAPAIEGCYPPVLKTLLGRLEESFDSGEPLLIGRALLSCFDFLLRYYSSLATGALKSVAPFPIESVLQESASILHCSKLLHYSLLAFEAYPENPVRQLLRPVFFEDEEPRDHTCWLGLSGDPMAGLENLSGWNHMLCRPDAHQRVDELLAEMERYHSLLCRWLDCSISVFERIEHVYDALSSTRVAVVFILDDELRFRGVPDLELNYGFALDLGTPVGGAGSLGAEPVPSFDDNWDEDLGVSIFDSDPELEALIPELGEFASADDVPSIFDSLNEGWTEQQIDQISRYGQALTFSGPEPRPVALVNRIAGFLMVHEKGLISVWGLEGVGKTFLSRTLTNPRSTPLEPEFPVIHFTVGRRLEGDYSIFIEVLNEHIRRQPELAGMKFRSLDPRVTQDLNARYKRPEQRFSAYLSALRQVNEGRSYLLILDGVDEVQPSGVGVRDFFPRELPVGVFLMLTSAQNEVEHLRPRLEICMDLDEPDFLTLLHQNLEPLEWSGAEVEQLIEKLEGRLAMLRLARDGVRLGFFGSPAELPSPPRMESTFEELLRSRFPQSERFAAATEFLCLLAAYGRPMALEDLAKFGFDFKAVRKTLEEFPSVFCFWGEDELVIGLAHPWFGRCARRFESAYKKACSRLVEQFLEHPSRRRLQRLPWWAIESTDDDLLQKLATHDATTDLRRQLTATMAKEGRYHERIELLDGWCELLQRLVAEVGDGNQRDERAWHFNSRGLSYFHLGHYRRALADIEIATEEFRELFERDGQLEMLNGLAAAYNRQAEAYLALEELELAEQNAERAVGYYAEAVEDLARPELTGLQALSLRILGEIRRRRGQWQQARDDLSRSVELYLKAAQNSPERTTEGSREGLARAYRTRGVVALSLGDDDAAHQDLGNAIEGLAALVATGDFDELRNELAVAFNNRATAAHRLGQLEQAVEDYEQAVAIRQSLVDEGRVDLRVELALSYTNRGLVRSELGETREALNDYAEALALRTHLVELENRVDLRSQLAFTHLCRGSTYRSLGSLELALDEYRAAAGQYEKIPASELTAEAAADQGLTLLSLSSLYLERKDYPEAERYSTVAVEVYRGLDSPHQLASAHIKRGQACRHLGRGQDALEAFRQAEQLCSQAGLDQLFEVRRNLCVTLMDLERHQEAVEVWQQLQSESDQSSSALADLYHLKYLIEIGADHLDRALEALTSSLEHRRDSLPEAPTAEQLESLCELQLELGRLSSAQGLSEEEHSERAVELLSAAYAGPDGGGFKPLLVRAHLARGQTLMQRGEVSAAGQQVRRALELGADREDPEVESMLERLLGSVAQLADAAQEAGESDTAVALWGLLIELSSSSHDEEAAHHYGPSLLRAYRHRGLVFAADGDLESALRDLSRSVELCTVLIHLEGQRELNSELAVSLVQRARVQVSREHSHEAALDLGRAIELVSLQAESRGEPEVERFLAITLIERAALAHQRGDFATVLSDLSQATRFLRAQSNRLDARGWLSLARAHRCLAEALEGLSYMSKAQEELSRALASFRSVSAEDGFSDEVDSEFLGALLQLAGMAPPATAVATLLEALDLLGDHPEWLPRYPVHLIQRIATDHSDGARRILRVVLEIMSNPIIAAQPTIWNWLEILGDIGYAVSSEWQPDQAVAEALVGLAPSEQQDLTALKALYLRLPETSREELLKIWAHWPGLLLEQLTE